MVTVIIVSNVDTASQNNMVALLARQISAMCHSPNWKWVGRVYIGKPVKLFNENDLSSCDESEGTVYRYIRTGDIIILKDGEYVY